MKMSREIVLTKGESPITRDSSNTPSQLVVGASKWYGNTQANTNEIKAKLNENIRII